MAENLAEEESMMEGMEEWKMQKRSVLLGDMCLIFCLKGWHENAVQFAEGSGFRADRSFPPKFAVSDFALVQLRAGVLPIKTVHGIVTVIDDDGDCPVFELLDESGGSQEFECQSDVGDYHVDQRVIVRYVPYALSGTLRGKSAKRVIEIWLGR
jgi:hypothetical protein